MKCPECGQEMEKGFMYERDPGGALFLSKSKDTNFMSHKNLEQIDLSKISVTGTGTQGVVPAERCEICTIVAE